MRKVLLWAPLLCGALAGPALAATYEWNEDWGQGVSMYSADDGNDNRLHIACPDYQDENAPGGGYVSAIATIEGRDYYTGNGDNFDVIVDGERWSNPFFTDCRACGASFPPFWETLRQANNLFIEADGVRSRIPTEKLASVIPPLDSPDNVCRSAW